MLPVGHLYMFLPVVLLYLITFALPKKSDSLTDLVKQHYFWH